VAEVVGKFRARVLDPTKPTRHTRRSLKSSTTSAAAVLFKRSGVEQIRRHLWARLQGAVAYKPGRPSLVPHQDVRMVDVVAPNALCARPLEQNVELGPRR
jgi:hypothetical protein